MFCATPIVVDKLAWAPVGPGPDAAVLLETRLVVNDATFRLLGFRVPMPYSAKWSKSVFWEDDKALHADGLVWDVASYRDFVRRVDKASDEGNVSTVIESETTTLDEKMVALARAWAFIAGALRWPGQDWRPAIIDGQPYLLFGYPEGPAVDGLPAITLRPESSRTWIGRGARERSFNLLIEGAVCGITCSEVRVLRTGDSLRRRPLEPPTWLTVDFDALLDTLPNSAERTVFHVGNRAMFGFLTPVDAEAWSFDTDRFVGAAVIGIKRGRLRWTVETPLDEATPEVARMVEALAERCRQRALVRIGSDMYVTCRLDKAWQMLGLPEAPEDDAALRNLIYAKLGRVVLRGLGYRANETSCLFTGRVIEKIYIFPDKLYLCVSPAFVNLANHLPPGTLMDTAVFGCFLETFMTEDPTSLPGWLNELPVVIDTPIRAVIRDIANLHDA